MRNRGRARPRWRAFYLIDDRTFIFCIGKKARDHFTYRNYNIIESHVDFWAEMEFEKAMMIGRSAIDHFKS